MAEELDIFQDTTALDIPSNFDWGAFQADLQSGFGETLSPASEGLRANPDGTAAGNYMFHYIGEDGLPYRENRTYNQNTGQIDVEKTNERVYYWQPSDEHKVTGRESAVMQDATSKTFGGNIGAGFYTEQEIRNAWANGEMEQLKAQGVTWDKYWNFVSGVTDLVSDGTLDPANSLSWMENDAYSSLVNGLGIQTDGYSSRGDVYNFNGFGYTRDYFADKTDAPVELINAVALGAAAYFSGPLLTNALTGTLGAAGASAASSAILSSVSQYMTTGEIDFGQALVSAAIAYGGAQLGDALENSGILGEIGDTVESVTQKFEDLLATGNSVADAAIKAGGMSLLTQLVTTGEVDPIQAGVAALLAGTKEGFDQFQQSLADAGKELSADDLQEIVVTAQKTGTEVGDGLTQLDNGLVINDQGVILGNMSDLDLDGDGLLSGNDLQNIDVTATPVPPTYSGAPKDLAYLGDFDGQGIYSDPNDPSTLYFQDGTVAATLDPNDPNRYSFKNPDGSEKFFGSLAEARLTASSGVINFEAQADQSFLANSERAIYDSETGSWISTGDPGNVAPENLSDSGYWVVRGEDGQLYVTNGYMKEKYRGGYDNVDLSKNPYLVDEFNSRDPIWQHVTNGGELPPAAPGTTGATVLDILSTEGTEPVKPPETQPTTQDPADSSGADQADQESTAAGQGSGPTTATGGEAGDSGTAGGATGAPSAGGQSGVSGIGSGAGFIPSFGAGDADVGDADVGDSTTTGAGASDEGTTSTSGVDTGKDVGTGQGGTTGVASGTGTGTGDSGADAGADTGAGQAADSGTGAGAGTDAGTGGKTGGGAGDEAGGGTGDEPGTGAGSGGAGDGDGTGGDGDGLFGAAGYKPTRPVGIGYELPEIPPLIEALQIDWTSSLAGLENRLQQDKLQQRNPSLFDGMV